MTSGQQAPVTLTRNEPTGSPGGDDSSFPIDVAAAVAVLSRAGTHPIVESFPHGAIIVFGPELKYLSAGGLGLADVGLSRQMLEGHTIFEVFPAEVCAVIEPLYRRALAGTESMIDVPFEGRIYQQRLGPVRDASGVIVAGMGFTQDVTETRRVEQALRESQQWLDLVMRHAPNGLAVLGMDMRFVWVNEAFCHITGYPSVAVAIGRHEHDQPDLLDGG